MITKKYDLVILKLGACLLLPVLLLSCQKETSKPLSALESHGKVVYTTYCIACHNPDPRYAGSIGPDLAGSSLELITSRVLHLTYPPGYIPKRKTGQMPALPFLEKDLPAIHAYLSTFSKK